MDEMRKRGRHLFLANVSADVYALWPVNFHIFNGLWEEDKLNSD